MRRAPLSLQPVDTRRPVVVHPRRQVCRFQRQRGSATVRRRLLEDAPETPWTRVAMESEIATNRMRNTEKRGDLRSLYATLPNSA